MERGNEAIELQFVTGQQELPVGQYCEARLPLPKSSRSICESGSIIALQLPAGKVRVAKGDVGYCVLVCCWGKKVDLLNC